jgi:hypothetical protein
LGYRFKAFFFVGSDGTPLTDILHMLMELWTGIKLGLINRFTWDFLDGRKKIISPIRERTVYPKNKWANCGPQGWKFWPIPTLTHWLVCSAISFLWWSFYIYIHTYIHMDFWYRDRNWDWQCVYIHTVGRSNIDINIHIHLHSTYIYMFIHYIYTYIHIIHIIYTYTSTFTLHINIYIYTYIYIYIIIHYHVIHVVGQWS